MPDYRPELEQLLVQEGCYRLDHLGSGIWKWYSPKTNIPFVVDPIYPSLKAAHEVLRSAGIGPVIKPKRD